MSDKATRYTTPAWVLDTKDHLYEVLLEQAPPMLPSKRIALVDALWEQIPHVNQHDALVAVAAAARKFYGEPGDIVQPSQRQWEELRLSLRDAFAALDMHYHDGRYHVSLDGK